MNTLWNDTSYDTSCSLICHMVGEADLRDSFGLFGAHVGGIWIVRSVRNCGSAGGVGAGTFV
jgi:hypothetical protein